MTNDPGALAPVAYSMSDACRVLSIGMRISVQ